ncbi:PREDICTED: UPF0725 protein At4g29550-like [Camelina sativa]|uniref:UPF0725 protein At4g29550-like n=1 Tax=Camelina sativa TaxID=90675 RepID=A0ABM0TY14_CAMSA|nr:PREDICTED: UPF0725 protein At4g29550-like [Camelina sativa]
MAEEEWSAAVINNPQSGSGWTEESDDDDVDPVLDQEFYRQLRDSDGFDVEICNPNSSIRMYKCANNEEDRRDDIVGICARVGLHWYNLHKGSNLKLMHVKKYTSKFCALMTYHITAEAFDPANDSRFTFQTRVTSATCRYDEDMKILTEVCRIKPKIQGTGDETKRWDDEAIDDFYKGDLPKLVPDDALMSSTEHDQFYELQESDIREHINWLNLYTEIAYFSLWEGDMRSVSCVPLQINKVIVHTREALESKDKLKAGNAIFYISFRDVDPLHGPPQDHRAIVRRTVDGIPGHFCLEFKCWLEDL